MKFGLNIVGVSPRHYPELAAAAEVAGFESVWVPEHLVVPPELPPTYLYSSDGQAPMVASAPLYDPIVLLATMVAGTSTLKFGTNVYILPLRHPVVVARSVLTLDRVSRGRVVFGVGVGWLEAEFRAVGEDFRTRGKRTDEIIPLLRRLWSQDVIEHAGEYYQLDPISFEPKPLGENGIPIEVGGASGPALRRAGALGDGWIEIGATNPDDFSGMARQVFAARAQAGRTGPFEVTSTRPADPAVIELYQGLGVTRTLLNAVDSARPAGARRDEVLARVERLGRQIVEQFR